MRFACMGYLDEASWARLSDEQRQRQIQACLEYDRVLQSGGHAAGGGCLGQASGARTLRKSGGKVQVTDGPYAETKEMLGGILYLEARDLEQAVELISKHPGLEMGPFEVRPVQAPPTLPDALSPEEEVRAVIARWSKALEARDVDAMMADYAEDAVLFDAIPPYKVEGRAGIAQAWRQCLPCFPEGFRSEHRDLKVQVDGDLAFVFGVHHFVVEKDHPCGQSWMRVSVGLRRVKGQWKVVHEHVSMPFNPLDDKVWKITDPAELTAPDYAACV